MKQYFVNFKNNTIKYWKLYVIKFGILLLGLYLFTLGIAIYVPTAVGASHMDFAIFSIIMYIHGVNGPNTTLDSNDLNYYPFMLMIYFLLMMSVSFIFGMISWIIKYKRTKDKTYLLNILLTLVGDIIITFILPQIIKMHSLYIPSHLWSTDNMANQNIRGLIFLGAYVIYVFGVASWVYSGWMLGPYNSICKNFMDLTKMKYNIARILMDILITSPGFIIVLVSNQSWIGKGEFLVAYINFGTIFFVIITGPTANLIIHKIFNKIINYDTFKTKLDQKKINKI